MKPDIATERADALLRLERTRMQWVLRSAHQAERSGSAQGADDLATGNPLNAVLTEWLASEITARLWPEPTDGDPNAPGDEAIDGEAGQRPPLPSQLVAQTLSEWTGRHPWLGVLAGLLAGSLAVSQRQRLLQWGISAALPWLASNAAVLALPLLAQWLARPPTQPMAEPPADQDTPSPPPGDTASPTGEGAPHDELSGSRSSDAGSPA